MVSWNRLLVADWRDPLVGRDILLGTLFGVTHYFLAIGGRYAEQIFNGDLKTIFVADSLIGLRSFWALLLIDLSTGIFGGFAYLCVLGVLFLLFRSRNYASVVLFLLIATVSILFFTTSLINLPFTLTISVLVTLIISRIGLLATIFSGIIFGLLHLTLFTLNFSAWFTNGMFLTLGLILVLLIYGFKVSIANQAFFAPLKSFES